MSRTIHVDVSPLCEERDIEEISHAFKKVARAVIASDRVRVGVVGGGLVAQAMHIPNLAALTSRFQLVGLAEPSETVRTALGARYGIAGLHADYRALLDAGGLDAVVIASPAGTHAEVALAALDAGLHVLSRSRCASPLPTPTRSSPPATVQPASSRWRR